MPDEVLLPETAEEVAPSPVEAPSSSESSIPVREKEIQHLLAEQYGGQMEVAAGCGRADIVVDDPGLLIEVKAANRWMHALGQVQIYGTSFPNHKKVIQLYGPVPSCTSRQQIRQYCRALDVAVWFYVGGLGDLAA